MKLKRVMTYSPSEKKVRICRISWRRVKGDPGYSRCVSVNLKPWIFRFWREWDGFFLTCVGVQVHFKASGCGTYPD